MIFYDDFLSWLRYSFKKKKQKISVLKNTDLHTVSLKHNCLTLGQFLRGVQEYAKVKGVTSLNWNHLSVLGLWMNCFTSWALVNASLKHVYHIHNVEGTSYTLSHSSLWVDLPGLLESSFSLRSGGRCPLEPMSPPETISFPERGEFLVCVI